MRSDTLETMSILTLTLVNCCHMRDQQYAAGPVQAFLYNVNVRLLGHNDSHALLSQLPAEADKQ